jgi:hypothetical protein
MSAEGRVHETREGCDSQNAKQGATGTGDAREENVRYGPQASAASSLLL